MQNFEKVHAPDGVHEQVEFNFEKRESNVNALAIVVMAMVFLVICCIAGLIWWVDA